MSFGNQLRFGIIFLCILFNKIKNCNPMPHATCHNHFAKMSGYCASKEPRPPIRICPWQVNSRCHPSHENNSRKVQRRRKNLHMMIIDLDIYQGVTTKIRCALRASEPFFLILGAWCTHIVINFFAPNVLQELLQSVLIC